MSKALQIADKFGNLFSTGTLAIKNDSNIAIGPNAKDAVSTNSQLQITGDTAFVTNKDSSLVNMYIGTTKYTHGASAHYIILGESSTLPANFVISGKFTLINKVGDLSIRTVNIQLSRTLGGYENNVVTGIEDGLEFLVTMNTNKIDNATDDVTLSTEKTCIGLKLNVKYDQQFDIFFEGYLSNLFVNTTHDDSSTYANKLFTVTSSAGISNESIFITSNNPYQQLKSIGLENRNSPVMVELLDGEILLIGGVNWASSYVGTTISNKVYRYNPITQITREVSPLPIGLGHGNFFRRSNGKVVAMFGMINYADQTLNKNIYEFDPKTDIWEQVGTISVPPMFEAAVARTPKKDVFLFIGGGVLVNGISTSINDVYEYNAVTRSFSKHPDLPFNDGNTLNPNARGLTNALMVQYVDSSGEIFILFTNRYSTKAYFYNPSTRNYRSTNVPSGITFGATLYNNEIASSTTDAYLSKDGKGIRIFGMADSVYTAETVATDILGNQKTVMCVFDPDKEYWKTGQTLLIAESYRNATMLTLKDDTILMYLSFIKGTVNTTAVYKYYPKNDSYIALSRSNKHRVVASYPLSVTRTNQGVTDLNGNVYVFGGATNTGLTAFTSNCYKYNPSADLWTAVASFPAGFLNGATGRFNTHDTLLNKTKIVCIGGYPINVSGNIAVYDIPTNTWEVKGSSLLPAGEVVINGKPVAISNDEVLFTTIVAVNSGFHNRLYTYKYSTNTVQRYSADLPVTATGFMALVVYNGYLYTIGGNSIVEAITSQKIYRMNLITKAWELFFTIPFGINAPSVSLINNGPEVYVRTYNSLAFTLNLNTKELVAAPFSANLGINAPLFGKNILVADEFVNDITNKMAILTLNYYAPTNDLVKVPLTYNAGSSGKFAANSVIQGNTLVSYGADGVPNAPTLIDLTTKIITNKAVRSNNVIQIDASLCAIEKTNSILVVGGRTGPITDISLDGPKTSTKIYEYNISTDTWTELATPMPRGVFGAAIVQVPNTLDFYLFAGAQNVSGTLVASQSLGYKVTLSGSPGSYTATVSQFFMPIGLQYGKASLIDSGRIAYTGARRIMDLVNDPYGLSTDLDERKYIQYYDIVTNTWSSERTNPDTTASWNISLANGTYIIVGENGKILTSSDGIGWTRQNSGTFNYLYDAIYVNGYYYVVGEKGTILTSPDAITWTPRVSPNVTDILTCIIYRKGRFNIGVGSASSSSAGSMLTSTDGITWTNLAGAPAYYYYDFAYNDNIIVACVSGGIDNRIVTSTDGITWTVRVTNNNNFAVYAVIYVNNIFVVTGGVGNTSSYIFTSPDGITWTQRLNSAGQNLHGIAYGNGVYVATGNAGEVYTSPDSITWTKRTSGVAVGLTEVIFANGLFIAVKASGGGTLISTDGITWTTPGNPILQPMLPNSLINTNKASASVLLDDSESLLLYNDEYYAITNIFDGSVIIAPQKYENSGLPNNLGGAFTNSLVASAKTKANLGADGRVYILASSATDNCTNELYVFS